MINSLETVGEDVVANLWATVGFESGVKEQTETALEVMREVAEDLPHMEEIAVVPVGSRFKGYATEQSDLDVAVIYYDDHSVSPYGVRNAIDEVVKERVGIPVKHPRFDERAPDAALTIDLVDCGDGIYPAESDLAFLFSPTVYIGSRAEIRRQEWIAKLDTRGEYKNRWINNAFNKQFITPKNIETAVLERYLGLLSCEEPDEPTQKEKIVDALKAAYEARMRILGYTVLH